jgi:transposase
MQRDGALDTVLR